MERTLFGFIWRYSKRQQIVILALTLCSFPILYMTLELPKWIVNDAIEGTEFPRTVFGMSFDQIEYLILLCFGFLGLVVLNNVVKFVLNIYKGVAGERMLRRLRYMLYNAILRFRLSRFRKVSSGELIPMITAEVEDVGVFIGEAIATPAFQGGTLLVYIVFIFAQDPFLGAAAISLYPLQAYVIPKLQRRVILLTRERIKNIRTISDRIGETVGAARDIQANDTSRYHLADLSDRLFLNYRIRLAIFRRKYMIKFLNNFLNQLPPFFFYSVGGYLVITGSLSFGALVAVLAAYKDLASPWKELLNWYQNLANVTAKYQSVIENFSTDDAQSNERLAGPSENGKLGDDLTLKLENVTASAGSTNPDVTEASLEVPPGGRIAVFGRDGSGRTELLMVLAGLLEPIGGRATLGGARLGELSQGDLAQVVSYVGADPFIFNDTIRNNVAYTLKTDPRGDGTDDFVTMRRAEAMLTGNALFDITAPWEHLERAGLRDPEGLDERIVELLARVGLENDLYRLGLSSYPDADGGFVERVLKARNEVARTVREDRDFAKLVELWRPDAINQSATIGENVLFALPKDRAVRIWETPADPVVRRALAEAGVEDLLMDVGARVAETMIELFSDTGADVGLITDYSFVAADELPAFEERLRRRKANKSLSAEDERALIGLAFRLIPARHRILTLTDAQERAIVDARPKIGAVLTANEAYACFDEASYVPPLSIEENILFGKPRVDRRGASERIDALLRDTIESLSLREPIAHAGLNFSVGVAGGSLSASQRRRIALTRALIKRPSILIVDAIADGDPRLLERIVGACAKDHTLIVGTADPAVAKRMSTTAVLRDGRLVATGRWDSVSEVALGDRDAAVMERQAS